MRSVVYGILLISSLLLFGCASAFDVYHVSKPCNKCGSEYGHEALFYTLPKTVITVDATVDKKDVTPGVCESWIKELFGPLTSDKVASLVKLPEKKPNKKDDEPVSLTADEIAQLKNVPKLWEPPVKKLASGTKLGAVVIGSRAEPDSDQIYAIKLSRKWYQKITSSFSLSETGLLTAAEMSVENQAVDFAVTTLKAAAGLAAKFMTAGGEPPPVNVRACQQVKDQIDAIREVRGRLIRGKQATVPPDGAALTLMLDKLAEQEKGLMAKFIGTVELTSGSVHCEITPAADIDNTQKSGEKIMGDSEKTKELFQIAEDGVVAGTQCRVPSDLVAKKAGASKVSLRFTTKPNEQLASIAKAASFDRTDPSGLVYRIPASSDIEVLVDDVPKAFDRRAVAQFGSIASLPRSADVAAFQSTVKAALYPTTGAMQKLDFAGTPQGTSAVTGVADAAGTILDARTAARKAEAAANDELAQLQRQRQILEEKKKILDLGGTPGQTEKP